MRGRASRAAALVVVVLCLAACRTVPMPPPTIIPVPSGFSSQAIEVAVLAGIANTHPRPSYDPRKALPQDQFEEMIGHDFISIAHGSGWFPGPREGNVRYAIVDTRGHYLKVAIQMNPDALRIDILETRDLMQENGRIHRTVIPWIDNLATHIRRELVRLTAYGDVPYLPPDSAPESRS